MRFGLSDLEELPSLKEFEALAREALGTDEGVAPGAMEEPTSDSSEKTFRAGEALVDAEGRSGDSFHESRGTAQSWRSGESDGPSGDTAATATAENDGDTHATAAEAIQHVEQGIAEAEAFREHEALATAEGMPSGQLDEDPPPPVVKSTSAGE